MNVTVDDFDPLFGYSNYDDWQTPDPSEHPTWYNATSDLTGVPWHEGACVIGGDRIMLIAQLRTTI